MIKLKIYIEQKYPQIAEKSTFALIPTNHLDNCHIITMDYGTQIVSHEPPFIYHSPLTEKQIKRLLNKTKIGYK